MMTARFSLRIRIFLIFAGLAGGALALLVAGLWLAYGHLGDPELIDAFVQGGAIAGFGILGLVTWIWYLFDINVARPMTYLAGLLRAQTHTDTGVEIDSHLTRYLGDIAPAASAATGTLAETRSALAEAVARETTRLSEEKRRLEALLSDVPVGVLLCSGDDQLVFYNSAAAEMMGAGAGLDRGLFDILRAGPVRHARDRLRATGDPEAVSDLLCATLAGGRLLAARMRLLPEAGTTPGYVLILRDVTADLAERTRREALLAEITDRVRRSSANLQMLIDVLPQDAAPPPDLDRALRDEAQALRASIRDLAGRQGEDRARAMPGTLTRASDLLDGLHARFDTQGLSVATTACPLILRGNGFDVVALLGHLAGRMAGAGMASAFRADIAEDGALALVRLAWTGPALTVAQLERWLAEPPDPAMPDHTGHAVIRAHGTEIWPETGPDGMSLCLPLPLVRHEGGRPAPIARAVVYDFDLLGRARNAAVADTALADLNFVVFDTETTGLLPDAGDEIVQIAATRIVNGRRIPGEVFDTLVNPQRPVPAASTAVHGITDAMVRDAPDIATAGRAFHRFASGAVLIAHNAPFDMAFLRRHEAGIGARFDNPILDTVLISAVLFGQHEVHSLDALCHRLGIAIPEEARHTAIGDTVATAEAFLRMLPILQARGLHSFGALVAELRRHGRLLRDLN